MIWLRRIIERICDHRPGESKLMPLKPEVGTIRCSSVCGDVVITCDGEPIGVMSSHDAVTLAKQLQRTAAMCAITGRTH